MKLAWSEVRQHNLEVLHVYLRVRAFGAPIAREKQSQNNAWADRRHTASSKEVTCTLDADSPGCKPGASEAAFIEA